MRLRHRVTHLVTRFAGSIHPPLVADTDLVWIRSVLTEPEFDIWDEQPRADKAESLAVARRAQATLSQGDTAPFIAAALLHDVGKTRARLGAVGRSAATIVAAVVGHPRVRSWATTKRGWCHRVGLYIAHDDLGAQELRQAGARPEAIEWARVHHRPEVWSEGTISSEICVVLARADGERV
jgi:putative nucleotidyltransferase with HDIG domain